MAPSPTPPAMIGATTMKSVWLNPSPSAVPTAQPTAKAAIEPATIGKNIFAKPAISARRSMPRIEPTMTTAMNR